MACADDLAAHYFVLNVMKVLAFPLFFATAGLCNATSKFANAQDLAKMHAVVGLILCCIAGLFVGPYSFPERCSNSENNASETHQAIGGCFMFALANFGAACFKMQSEAREASYPYFSADDDVPAGLRA